MWAGVVLHGMQSMAAPTPFPDAALMARTRRERRGSCFPPEGLHETLGMGAHNENSVNSRIPL